MIRSRQGGRKSAAPESAIAAAPEAAPAPEQAQEPEAAPALEPAPAIAPDAAPAAPSGDARGYAAAALSFQPVNHFTVHDFFLLI
ncbi:hypothetical protein B9Z55_020584 [Caenorhabditis nigoni]|uniref:Uncharacterized protein n=1 Tax=Caenorhabditis nigoni TaxID=1611254 RepID=A0A2G5TNC9_9PELO|nr:hypothetical protein B9Z55_020584 [Caenorhabditis nigoni]